jgi:hypothetical protein
MAWVRNILQYLRMHKPPQLVECRLRG